MKNERQRISKAIDDNSGRIWQQAEHEWQRLAVENSDRFSINHIHVVYVMERNERNPFKSHFAGVSLSANKRLSSDTIIEILTAAIAQAGGLRIIPVVKPPNDNEKT